MKVFNHLFRLIALTALLVMAFQNCAKMKAQNLVPEESFDVTALSSDNGITLNEVPGEDDVNPDLINCANSTGGVFYAGQFHVCNVNIVELQRQFEAKCGVDFEGTGWNNSLIRFSNFSAGSSCQESVVNGALPSRGFRCDNPGLLTISFSAFTDIGSPGAPCSLRATKKVIVNPTNPNAFNYSQGLNVLSMVYKALLNREPDLPSSGGGAWGYLQMLMEPTRNAPSARNGTIAKVIRPIGDSSEFVFASLSIPPRESIRR
ncbi:MAG: hypothetical protein KDD25_10410, partial [Bdellovibrionales bacterium]|nr:hypothetical protein [Bdellovibrionales bacterium]